LIVLVDERYLLEADLSLSFPDEDYAGHFIVISGFDGEDNFTVFDPECHCDLERNEPLYVPRDQLNKARKASGTDEDVIVVFIS
jgi:hypothetical protein